ncbi:MAG: TolC family protein [Sphingobacteriales bacterium]|nr:MAG: TolC family protein [Sphingobacteriales bacterium]
MRRLLYSLSLIITLLPGIARAQQPTALRLKDAVDYALKNQAKIKNARLDELSNLARNKEVAGLALPKVNASAGITYAALVAAFQVPDFISGVIKGAVKNDAQTDVFRNTPVGTLPLAFQPKWTTNPIIEASQILFDPSVMVALQAREKVEELSAKAVEKTEQDVRYDVTRAYYDILVAEKRKTILDQNVIRIGQMEHETRVTYDNGVAEKLDVDRLTVSLNNLKTEQIRINQLIGIAYMALKFQMGMPLNTPVTLEDSLIEEQMNADLIGRDLDVKNRKEFQLLTLQKDLQGYDLKRYKLGGLPTLAAFGNFGYTLYNQGRLFDAADEWQKNALVGVKLTVPIFDGFQRKNKVKQAQFTLDKTDNDLQNLKLGLELETISARINLQSSIAALENQRANMRLAEEVYRMSSIKYKEGVGSSLEVLDAESALKEAQVNYFGALYDATTARINLQKALGEF